MASTLENSTSGPPRLTRGSRQSDDLPPSGAGGRWIKRGLGLLVVAAGLAVAAYYAPGLVGSAAGPERTSLSLHTVSRSDLVVTVTEDGSIESASNIEVKCQVAGGSAILWIVPDGQVVKKGDKLVELDAAALDEQINTQKITYEKARSAVIQAEKDFEVAKISVKEYLEGTYRKELQTAEAQITIALENLRSAQNALEYSQRMFRKGYVSSLEMESQQFAVQRAQLDLDAAETTKDVLERFTKVKMLEDLNSKRDTAEAKMKSEQSAFALEELKLKRLEDQRKNCVILAPQDGMVVYANEAGSRFGPQTAAQISEGAAVRERQTILRLPDLAKMQVKVNVHESKVEQLKPGMRARIRVLDREEQGAVVSIANQPEPNSFFSASVKEYATIVAIEGTPEGLKPGMTAEVEILVAHLQDVITVPVAAVVEQRGEYFSWVPQGADFERRKLLLGLTNDQFVEVQDGLQEGEQIVRNPRAVVGEATVGAEGARELDVEKRFGSGASDPGAGSAPGREGSRGNPAGPGGGSAPGPGGPGGGGPGGGGPGGGGPGGGGPGGGARPSINWGELDKDGDGKVSKEEAPETLQRFFDRVDSNGDGFLDEAEQQAMQQRRGSGGGRNLMQFDKDGDGKVTREEAPEIQGFFDRVDTNGDGAIDAEEVSASQARMQQGGLGGPPAP